MPEEKSRPNLVTVFSDASVSGDCGGYAWWFRWNGPAVKGDGGIGTEDIGEAELKGLLEGIRAARLVVGVTPLDGWVVQCDNQYALACILTLPNAWIARTSPQTFLPAKKIRPVMGQMLDEIRQLIPVEKIWLKHVKGHTKGDDARSKVNHDTDRRALVARKAYQEWRKKHPKRRP